MNTTWLLKRMPGFEKRHARGWARARVAIAAWLVLLTAILYGYGRAGWWTPLLLVAAAAHLYAAYCLHQLDHERRARGLAA
ncbi:MAG TPA: hypothetical protein VMF14_09205 [Solirubrobacteraceae bacterium]|nr:hypothetical protein [Solirubrobacteraceae bacterium]